MCGRALTLTYDVCVCVCGIAVDTSPLTREDHMKYFISGLSEDETNKVSMPMGTTLVEKTTGMKVLVHWPMSSFQGRGGAAYPQVVTNELQEPVQFATYYPVDNRSMNRDGDRLAMGITDFVNQEWHEITDTPQEVAATMSGINWNESTKKFMMDRREVDVFLLRPQTVLMMNNALFFSEPGVNTGSFLVAFPHTGVSTNQVNESMRLSMRIHLGCIVKQPENVIVMRHVQCAGFVKGHGANIAKKLEEWTPPTTMEYGDGGNDLCYMAKEHGTPWSNLINDSVFQKLSESGGPYKNMAEFASGNGEYDEDGEDVPTEIPVVVYRGAVKNMETDRLVYRNNGHLGPLDNPACCDMIAGRQKYGEIPDIGAAM